LRVIVDYALQVGKSYGVALGNHKTGGVHQGGVGERGLVAAFRQDRHTGRDRVVFTLVQPRDERVPLDVLTLDLVDAQVAVDLAVQGDRGTGELAVVLLPAVGALAREGDSDRALLLQLRQEVAVTFTSAATAAAIGGTTGRQRQGGSACSH